MNERAIELYKQAIEFAYTSIGKEHADTTYFQGVVAGKHAELIVKECSDLFEIEWGEEKLTGNDVGCVLKKHFGVE